MAPTGADDRVWAQPTRTLWHDTLEPGDDGSPRAPLPGDLQVDVAIVGAGFSGVWTAYHLLKGDPSLRVAILEAGTAGYGASGRNGGWCVGDQTATLKKLERQGGTDAAVRMTRAVQQSVDEVGDIVRDEGIDCGFHKGGAIYLSTSRAQHRRHIGLHKTYAKYGLEDAYRVLGANESREIVRSTGVVGSVFKEHCAALNPAALTRGVARAIERMGGAVYERTPVTRIDPGVARTVHGDVTADLVIRATEAYTSSLEGQAREVLPLGNTVIATEPLTDAQWDEIGLSNRECFEDSPYLLGYGQRTADGRIAWGGLAATYRWRSRVPTGPVDRDVVAERLRARLVERFPVLHDVQITHQWGGILGMTRDWRPGVGLDRANRTGWIGGYFGAGVAAAQTAGRSLADLILERDTDHARLPWVGHRSRRWEPEPLRWIGIRSALAGARATDALEDRRG